MFQVLHCKISSVSQGSCVAWGGALYPGTYLVAESIFDREWTGWLSNWQWDPHWQRASPNGLTQSRAFTRKPWLSRAHWHTLHAPPWRGELLKPMDRLAYFQLSVVATLRQLPTQNMCWLHFSGLVTGFSMCELRSSGGCSSWNSRRTRVVISNYKQILWQKK